MTLDDVLALIDRSLAKQGELRTAADQIGDAEQIIAIDARIAETLETRTAIVALIEE